MTDLPQPSLDLRAEIARIDRDRAETAKLISEARKLDVDRLFAPLLAIAAVLAAVLSTATGLVGFLIGQHLWRP
jgi:hypothetical protein